MGGKGPAAHRRDSMPQSVFLVDITNRIGDATRRSAVKAVLQAYFDKVGAKAKSDKISVMFVSENPEPNDNDLLGYYSTSGWHVVFEMAGAPEVKSTEGRLAYTNRKVTGSD